MSSVCQRDTVDAKRSWEIVPVGFDWHDFLIQRWGAGREFLEGFKIRLPRSRSKGLQFRCLQSGWSGSREPVWPVVDGGTTIDGTATWVAEDIAPDSLRTTIFSNDWPPVDGVTLTDAQTEDLRYTIRVGSGVSGSNYSIKQQIVCVNGERSEGVIILPVQD